MLKINNDFSITNDDKINELFSLAFFDSNAFQSTATDLAYHTKGKNYWINFIGNDATKTFDQYSNNLYHTDKFVHENFSTYTFDHNLVLYLEQLKLNEPAQNENLWKQFLKQLKNCEEIEATVMIPIYGMRLNKPFLKINSFNIFTVEHVKTMYPDHIGQIEHHYKYDYFLSLNTKSKDIIKCRMIAEKKFQQFLLLINFVIALAPGVSNIHYAELNGRSKYQQLYFSNNEIGHVGTSLCSSHEMLLTDLMFEFSSNPKLKLIDFIIKEPTGLKLKILQASLWFGKAYIEKDKPRALVQYIFGWECLFVSNERKTISESIIAQLSDNIAFLLNDDVVTRKKTVKAIRDLYDLRSGVAHGGSSNISNQELWSCSRFSNLIIIKLLGDETYAICESKEQMLDVLKTKKYT